MVNINTIKTIKDAKNAIYNNKELTSDEKTIFDNQLLKKWDGRIDLDETKNTALLLDDVKRAEKAELSDGLATVNDLLEAMKKAKEHSTISYRVVNSYNKLVDEAINRLGGLSKQINVVGGNFKGKFEAANFSLDKAEITDDKGADNLIGIGAVEDVKLSGDFKITGATITATSGKVARTEREIELEIANKKKALERKEKMLNLHIEKGNDEKMEQVEKEITKLEEEIGKLELEKEQVAQIEVGSK